MESKTLMPQQDLAAQLQKAQSQTQQERNRRMAAEARARREQQASETKFVDRATTATLLMSAVLDSEERRRKALEKEPDSPGTLRDASERSSDPIAKPAVALNDKFVTPGQLRPLAPEAPTQDDNRRRFQLQLPADEPGSTNREGNPIRPDAVRIAQILEHHGARLESVKQENAKEETQPGKPRQVVLEFSYNAKDVRTAAAVDTALASLEQSNGREQQRVVVQEPEANKRERQALVRGNAAEASLPAGIELPAGLQGQRPVPGQDPETPALRQVTIRTTERPDINGVPTQAAETYRRLAEAGAVVTERGRDLPDGQRETELTVRYDRQAANATEIKSLLDRSALQQDTEVSAEQQAKPFAQAELEASKKEVTREPNAEQLPENRQQPERLIVPGEAQAQQQQQQQREIARQQELRRQNEVVAAEPRGKEIRAVVKVQESSSATGPDNAKQVFERLQASGAKVGMPQTRVDDNGRINTEIPVSYRTDDQNADKAAQTLASVAKEPGVGVSVAPENNIVAFQRGRSEPSQTPGSRRGGLEIGG